MNPQAILPILLNRRSAGFVDDFNRANGAAGNGWSGGTISGGSFYITPTLGTELITNGAMESGSPPANWTPSNASINTAVADERTGGSGAQSLQIERIGGTGSTTSVTQNVGSTLGKWLLLSGWAKNMGATIGSVIAMTNIAGQNILSASWTQVFASSRATTSSVNVTCTNTTGTLNTASRFDDLSLKEITPASMFATRAESTVNGASQANITRTTNTQAGIAHWADSSNFVIAYLDGAGNVRLEKCISGTYTTLAAVGVSYAVNAPLKLARNGTTYTVSYNNAQVIAATSVTDAVMSGTSAWGLFSTHAGNSFDQYERTAA